MFVFSVSEILGWERDWSGPLGSGDPASSCSGGWVVQVTCFLLDGECRIGVGWRGCRWGLVCFTRHETHTHHPHARHAPRGSLSLSSCEHSLVSCLLSVASLVSCLSCFVSALLLSSVCPVLFVSFLCASVCLCLSACLSLACPCLCVLVRSTDMCASFRSAKKVNAWIRAPATARDLESV